MVVGMSLWDDVNCTQALRFMDMQWLAEELLRERGHQQVCLFVTKPGGADPMDVGVRDVAAHVFLSCIS